MLQPPGQPQPGEMPRTSDEDALARTRLLAAIQEVAEALKSTLDINSIAEIACRAVVRLFDVDHSALLLFDSDKRKGHVCAEYPPDLGTKGTVIPLAGIQAEEEMVFAGKPILVQDVVGEKSLGEVSAILSEFGILSILIVPVVLKGIPLGSFSLDHIGRRRPFTQEQIELCQVLAAQLAVAIHNAQLFQSSQRQVQLLELLRQTALDVTSQLDSHLVLNTIIERAVHLLEAKGGGIEEYSPERHEITVVADCGPDRDVVGEVLREGEGVAGKLVQGPEPVMIVPNYAEWIHRPVRYAEQSPFGALIAVRLTWRDKTVGVLYVDDAPGRDFTSEDGRLLQLFGEYAATSLVTAKMVRELNQREIHLKRLVAGSPMGVIANDRNGRITDFNERAEVMFGYARHEVLGRHVALLFHKSQEPYILGDLLRASPEGRIADHETLAVAKNGDTFPVRMAVTWLYEEQGELAGCAAYVQDLRDLEGKKQLFVRSALYHQITDSIQAANDLDEVLRIVLTGVTAGYGLGFNSAALFLLDPTGNTLMAKMGVGHVDVVSALQDWSALKEDGAEDFEAFRERLKSRALRSTPLGARIAGLEMSVGDGDGEDNLLREVVQTGHFVVIPEGEEVQGLPRAFLDAYEPAAPLAIVALRSRQRVAGLLVADNRFTRTPITSDALLSLISYANSAAIAIDNKALLEEAQQAQERLEESFSASTALTSSGNPTVVLKTIVEQARLAAEAWWVSVIVVDEQSRQGRNLVLSGTDKPYDIRAVMRPHGLSMEVIRTGQPVVVENTYRESHRVNELMLRDGIGAALCLPLTVEGKTIAVMWLHYKEPRHFLPYEIRALQLYANQAATAYETAVLVDHLQRARETAGVVARAITAEGLDSTLRAVAQGTIETLGAHAVALYVYDNRKGKLEYPPTLEGVWYPDLARARAEVPPTSVVYSMLRQDDLYIVPDVSQDRHFSGLRFAIDEEIRSLVAAPLKVTRTCVGVMFVNYRELHQFDEEELSDMRLFADQAAVAIRSAQLYDEVSRHAQALRSIQATSAAFSSVLDLEALLPVITENAAAFFDASATGLMLWDEPNENLVIRATCGLSEEYRDSQRIPRGTVERLLRQGKLTTQVMDLRESPPGDPALIRSEGLCNVLVTPLVTGGELMGILNVYSKGQPRTFSARDMELAGIFAQYAAIAILNARQLRLRDGLLRAAQVVIAGGDLLPALRVIAQSVREGLHCDVVALYAYDAEKKEISYPSVIVGTLKAPEEQADWSLISRDNTVPLFKLNDNSVIRRLIANSTSRYAVRSADDQVFAGSAFIRRENIASSAGIPLLISDRPVGFLFINYRSTHEFSPEEKQAIDLFAVQAALAIESARRYDELRRTKGMIGASTAVAWMGMANNTWRHSIEGDAINIRNNAALVLQDLTCDSPLRGKIELIGQLAKDILTRPVTPPLSSEEGAMLVNLNQMIPERIGQLRVAERFSGVTLEVLPCCEGDARVWVSPEWLRIAVDYLLDNSLRAVSSHANRTIRVHIGRAQERVEIAIEDNGPGIPPDVLPLLFQARIKGKGMGMGLMMAQVITQAYGGEIEVTRPGPGGTIITISLPSTDQLN